MLIAPMEEMECDHLAWQDDYLVARCGQGQAMLVLRYQDGDDELEEIDFIDLQGEGPGQQEQEQKFGMKGGQRVSSLSEVGVILVASQGALRLTIRMLKNRSYIT